MWPNDQHLTTAHIIDQASIKEAYAHYHQYLASESIDFVKIDGQAFLEKVLPSNLDLEQYSKAYQNAAQSSVSAHFNKQNIHCMAHEPYILQYASCAIWRNSDDYFPKEEDQGKHIRNNIYNNLWSQFIGTPDWDMFQTPHKHSEYHAIARIISGGPIYISDIPGEHDHALLEKLTIHGNQLLKPDNIALPAIRSLFSAFDDRHQLIMANNIANDCGLLAVFNCQNYGYPLNTMVSVKDLRNLDIQQNITVYSSRTKKTTMLAANESLYVELPAQQAELLTFIPITENYSFIGIVDKILSIKTIEEISIDNNIHAVSVKCGGTFMFNYYGNDDFYVSFNGKPLTCRKSAENTYLVMLPDKGKLMFS